VEVARTCRVDVPTTYAGVVRYPAVLDASKVGTYAAAAKAGGGFVWDEVLEYRVWCHPERGAPEEADGSDYYRAFASYAEAAKFAAATPGAEEPLALVLQREYIDEPQPGKYMHVKKRRVAEWPVEFLRRPRRAARTIPDFVDPHAPPNRLEILRGEARRPRR
jgi:hypothetical protein